MASPRQSDTRGPQVSFTRLPISLPCPVPIRPGDPATLDDMGEPLPLEDRTELCAVDAFWMVGLQPTCDVHLRDFCRVAEIDYDDEGASIIGPATYPYHPVRVVPASRLEVTDEMVDRANKAAWNAWGGTHAPSAVELAGIVRAALSAALDEDGNG